MRVIAGTCRGRVLISLDGNDVRPTTDKVKEAIFSAIQFDLPDAHVLDLFSGTGQMGIEALSRGAEQVDFLDASLKSIQCTKKNIQLLGLENRTKVIQQDSISYLKLTQEKYHLAILDPPYHKEILLQALPLLSDHLFIGGKAICEHESELILPAQIELLSVKKRYRYGKIAVTVYEKVDKV